MDFMIDYFGHNHFLIIKQIFNIDNKTTFLIAALRMRTTWRRCYGPYCLPHTHHTYNCEFHLDYAL